MAMKARTLVGLDVHARQTHAAIVDSGSGEVRVCKLRIEPEGVVVFLDGSGQRVLAMYEAGPTGFGLARAARSRGIEVHVVAPGSIPKATGGVPPLRGHLSAGRVALCERSGVHAGSVFEGVPPRGGRAAQEQR